MRHARREQTDRRQLLALLQLLFKRDARGNVFEYTKRAGLALCILQRRERDVQNERTIFVCSRVELVDIADLFESPAVFAEHLFQRVSEVFGEQILDATTNRRIATQIENVFERRVQTRYTSFQIDRQQSNVDRLDDRLIEFLQQLQLCRAFLLVLIKQTILDRDCDVTGNRAQDLDVFGRKQPAIDRASETKPRDHSPTHDARNV